jgi:ankyrin repeat protein
MAQKIHRRSFETKERQQRKQQSVCFAPLKAWEPTDKEKKAWNLEMMQILQSVAQKADDVNLGSKKYKTKTDAICSDYRDLQSDRSTDHRNATNTITTSRDKSGQLVVPYRESLAPFLKAAAEGDLTTLKELVDKARDLDRRESAEKGTPTFRNLKSLLDTKDRHKSIADHWAAGSGHLDCLRFLEELRLSLYEGGNNTQEQSSTNTERIKVRRRDGKTCLHYAARNGHIDCIQYLLQDTNRHHLHHQQPKFHELHPVDERSGEGTTPLHLACYGGHPTAVKYLIEEHGANVHAKNDFGCSCAHWAAMTISKSESDVRELCSYLLKEQGLSFVETQGQGHTALHKAAQRCNRHVIQWMADPISKGGAGLSPSEIEQAGTPDQGGHRPSEIWKIMGGDDDFSAWMKTTMGW